MARWRASRTKEGSAISAGISAGAAASALVATSLCRLSALGFSVLLLRLLLREERRAGSGCSGAEGSRAGCSCTERARGAEAGGAGGLAGAGLFWGKAGDAGGKAGEGSGKSAGLEGAKRVGNGFKPVTGGGVGGVGGVCCGVGAAVPSPGCGWAAAWDGSAGRGEICESCAGSCVFRYRPMPLSKKSTPPGGVCSGGLSPRSSCGEASGGAAGDSSGSDCRPEICVGCSLAAAAARGARTAALARSSEGLLAGGGLFSIMGAGGAGSSSRWRSEIWSNRARNCAISSAEARRAPVAAGACAAAAGARPDSGAEGGFGGICRFSRASNTCLQRPQRTRPEEIRSWSGTTLNKVAQTGQRVISAMRKQKKEKVAKVRQTCGRVFSGLQMAS